MFKYLLFTTFLVSTLFANATLLSQNISYIQLEDRSYSQKEILAKDAQGLFQPLQTEHTRFGYISDIFWLKVDVNSSHPLEQRYLLEFEYPLLDYVDIFELIHGTLILKKELGDLRPFDQDGVSTKPSYIFSLTPAQTRHFFIKVKTDSNTNIGLHIEEERSYLKKIHHSERILSLYFGAVIIMLAYNFLIFLIVRREDYFYYVLFHLVFFGFSIGLSGAAFELLWPNTPSINYYFVPIAIMLSAGFSIKFSIHFLQLKRYSLRLYQLLNGFFYSTLIVSLTPFIFGYATAIKIASFLALLAVLAFVLILFYFILYQRTITFLFYAVAWTSVVIGSSISILGNAGIIPSNEYIDFAPQIGSSIEMLLLSIGLAYSYNQLKNEHQTLKVLDQKKSNVIEEQERFNNNLSQANERLITLSQTDPLTKIYNRRYFYSTVNEYLSDANNNSFTLLMLDLDFFKNINDTYGHDVGDKVLISFSKMCQTMLRNDDIFARYGGEEFVLFLPHTDKESAIAIAQRVLSSTREISIKGSEELKVNVSIGLSSNNADLEVLLQEADKALYRAKELGRDRLESFNA